MNRVLLVVLISALGLAPTVSAQTTGADYQNALTTSLASVAKTMHASIRRDLAEAAVAMPADEYSFRPTSEVRSFAQLIGHVVNANWFFCSQAKQERPPNTTNHETLTAKDALVKALNDSLSYCDDAYAVTTDTTFNQAVQMLSGAGAKPVSTVRGAILMFNTTHNNEHYGNVVVYLRLKGHVPPSTTREQQGRK